MSSLLLLFPFSRASSGPLSTCARAAEGLAVVSHTLAPQSSRLLIDLSSGCVFSFDPSCPAALAAVQVRGWLAGREGLGGGS